MNIYIICGTIFEQVTIKIKVLTITIPSEVAKVLFPTSVLCQVMLFLVLIHPSCISFLRFLRRKCTCCVTFSATFTLSDPL